MTLKNKNIALSIHYDLECARSHNMSATGKSDSLFCMEISALRLEAVCYASLTF